MGANKNPNSTYAAAIKKLKPPTVAVNKNKSKIPKASSSSIPANKSRNTNKKSTPHQGADPTPEGIPKSVVNINPSPEMSSSISLPDLTAEVPSPSPAVSGKSLTDVTEKTPLPSSDSLPIVGEPGEDGAKSISIETKSSIITVIKKQTSEDGFSVPESNKRARHTSPKSGSGEIELSNSFSPLETSPSSKKQAVTVAEVSEMDTSNSSTKQPKVESVRPKHQRLSRSETKISPPIDVAKRETKIPTHSTPSAVETVPRKPNFSRQDFSKSPKDKAPQSKQVKTGKKPS